MTTVTADSMHCVVPETKNMAADCECTREELGDSNFFGGILLAVPAGLLLWVGALKLAGQLIHHFIG